MEIHFNKNKLAEQIKTIIAEIGDVEGLPVPTAETLTEGLLHRNVDRDGNTIVVFNDYEVLQGLRIIIKALVFLKKTKDLFAPWWK